MKTTENKTSFTTISIQELSGKKFFVEDYQRGYKWSVQQVIDLLSDINEFNLNDGFYCLQPLALINKEQNEYEVIDGQQRLSTVFIILSIIADPIYEISYRTRDSSEKFLKDIKDNLESISIMEPLPSYENIEKLEEGIKKLWMEYVEDKKYLDNTDNYHFFTAFFTIDTWLKNSNVKVVEFFQKLTRDTRFIWYEESNINNSKIVFRNLNSGKIALTNAELIKANYINNLKDLNKEIQTLLQNNLAAQWDMIEQELHNDNFWFFINNTTDKGRYETRIDLLFELMVVQQPKYNDDKLYTYREFSKPTENSSGLYEWEEVVLKFYQLKEWYEDNELYHLIGYLVATEVKGVRDIIKLSENKGKSDFKAELIKSIKAYFQNFYNKTISSGYVGNDYLEMLDYYDSYKQLMNTLFLYNIEIYILSNAHYRFPFDLSKNTKWTLEHIHAQKAKDFKTVTEVDEWAEDIKQLKIEFQVESETSSKDFPIADFDDILKELKELKINKNISLTKGLGNKVTQLNKELKTYFNLHSIKNMALLDGSTNSKLSNKSFNEKREEIIKIDKKKWGSDDKEKKPFIPIGTKNVFMKYTSTDVLQMNFWRAQDRIDYIKHIRTILSIYLPKKEQ